MDYSAANTGLWNFFVQMGIIAGMRAEPELKRQNGA